MTTLVLHGLAGLAGETAQGAPTKWATEDHSETADVAAATEIVVVGLGIQGRQVRRGTWYAAHMYLRPKPVALPARVRAQSAAARTIAVI